MQQLKTERKEKLLKCSLNLIYAIANSLLHTETHHRLNFTKKVVYILSYLLKHLQIMSY